LKKSQYNHFIEVCLLCLRYFKHKYLIRNLASFLVLLQTTIPLEFKANSFAPPPEEYSLVPVAGDIVFTCFQSAYPDAIEWITLRRLDLRNLKVTDNGIASSGLLLSAEGTYTFPNISSLADVPAGTIVRLDELSGTNDFDPSDGVIHIFGSGTTIASAPNFNLGINGDQAIVYSGTSTSPTYIAGITGASSVANWNSGATGVTTSRAPGTSSDLYFSSNDNAFYNGTASGNSTVIKSSALNTSFWNVSASSQVARFDRKNILFDEPIYVSGNLVVSNVTSTSLSIDASSIAFINEYQATTRYAILVRQGALSSNPADRYTCYPTGISDLTENFSTANSVVSSATNICTGTNGTGKIVYLGYDKPSNFVVNGLAPNTNYHISFYALNGNGWSTNFSSSFVSIPQTTLISPPFLVNSPIGAITENSAALQSQVVADGGSTVVERGFFWDTYPNPDFPGLGSTWDGTGTGFFNNTIFGLDPQTQYWSNAYAANAAGIGLGMYQSFFTLSNRPTTQVSEFLAAGMSASQINLAWELSEFPSTGATVKGYVLIRAANGLNPTFSAQNGNAPSVSVGQIVASNISASQAAFSDLALTASTIYTYQIIPFCWDGVNPQTYHYLSASAPFATANTFSIGCSKPTVQVQNPVATQASITSINLSWQNGSGNQTLVIARENYPVSSIPQDGSNYTGNSLFGSGTQISANEFVVFNGNSNSVTIGNLNPGSIYFFSIYTFNSSGFCYLSDSPSTTSFQLLMPNSVIETFEPSIKPTYATAVVQGNLGLWTFNDALIGTTPGEDQFNGTRSARIINGGSIEMAFEKPNGLSEITLQHASFGADGNSTWQLEVSNNGGSSFDAFVSPIFTSSTNASLTQVTLPTTITGNIKIRIQKLTGGSNRINIDDISFVSLLPNQTIETLLPSSSTLCLSATGNINIPYSITGVFQASNIFFAEISDPSGSFENPTLIGQLSSNVSGSIGGAIPSSIPSGNGYKIRVKSTAPAIVGTEISNPITVISSVPNVNGFYAEVINGSSVRLNWQNPSACFDEILIVGKLGNTVTASPSGNGATYVPNSTFGFAGSGAGLPSNEFAVLKQAGASTVIVSGLSNLSTYYFKVFVRSGNTWSNGLVVSISPFAPQFGDFQTASSGNYTNPAIWLTYNGVSWVAANRYPNQFGALPANINVKIRTGHTVVLDNNLPTKPIKNLTLEVGSRLFTNDSTINANRYLTVFGNILCNGNIGNGFNRYDNISFNIEGSNCTISGTGTFNCGRMRKNSTTNASTRLIFGMSAAIKYGSGTGRGCGLYNNANGDAEFSITVNANCTLDLLAPTNEMADFALDGTDGEAPQQRFGTLTVLGSMNVSGTIYALTNNINRAVKIEVEQNGKLSCSAICTANAGSLNSSVHQGSNVGGSTLRVKSRGILEITGGKLENPSIHNLGFCKRNSNSWPGNFTSGLGIQNSIFDFQASSTVVYSGKTGKLFVQADKLNYANLTFTNKGAKEIVDTLRVSENLSIMTPSVFNAQNNLIYLGGNWINQSEKSFSEATSTVIFEGSSSQMISNRGGEVFYNISLQNPAAINSLGDLQVRNQLEMVQGNLQAENLLLTLGESVSNTGNLQYQNGRIIGKMRRWFGSASNSGSESGLFPIGNSLHDQFVTVEYMSAPSSGGTLTAGFVPENMAQFGVPTNPFLIAASGSCPEFLATNLSEQGYWEMVDASGLSGGTYDITFEADGFSIVTDPCLLTALKRVGSGSWEESGSHTASLGIANRPVVKREGASGWSNWGFGAGGLNPLPIELIDFTVEQKATSVELKWRTASELNNAQFVIERSSNAVNFDALLSVPGAGNSNVVLEYMELDQNPLAGISYYRLKQIDFNGDFTYSPIKPVNFSASNRLLLNSWSLSEGTLNLDISTTEKAVTVVVYDISGRTIKKSDFNGSDNSLQIGLPYLSHGIYMVSISDGKDYLNFKVFR
jgi:hypothetical protein